MARPARRAADERRQGRESRRELLARRVQIGLVAGCRIGNAEKNKRPPKGGLKTQSVLGVVLGGGRGWWAGAHLAIQAHQQPDVLGWWW